MSWGCIAPMSAKASGIHCRSATLTLPDGVVLQSRLWHPQGNGPWPALLMRQPYGSRIASTVTCAHPTWWAAQGFLVVVQDVRGQGESDGRFGGFGQEETEIVLQKPERIIGYLAFCFSVLLTQVLLILKKKQFEKVQAAELNF